MSEHQRTIGPVANESRVSEGLADTYDDEYDHGESCQTCLGEGFEECEDWNTSEGCWEPDCSGTIHTCPNCRGSGRAKDQWYW